MRGFVERYFTGIDEIWQTRTAEMAQTIVVRLFPRLIIEQDIVDRADAWLAETDTSPALRRLVIEGRADVVRALAAQERDRAAGEFLVPHLALPTADSLAGPRRED